MTWRIRKNPLDHEQSEIYNDSDHTPEDAALAFGIITPAIATFVFNAYTNQHADIRYTFGAAIIGGILAYFFPKFGAFCGLIFLTCLGCWVLFLVSVFTGIFGVFFPTT